MDLLIRGDLTKLLRVLQSIGFEIDEHKSHHAAKLPSKGGRMHLLLAEFGDPETIFCDAHFDRTVHFLGFGVDYNSKPRIFYNEILQGKLESNGFQTEILGGFDWSTRKNKAVVAGLRLDSHD